MPSLPVILRSCYSVKDTQPEAITQVIRAPLFPLPTHTPEPVKSFPALKNYLVGVQNCRVLYPIIRRVDIFFPEWNLSP